jgi:hypothetical protein
MIRNLTVIEFLLMTANRDRRLVDKDEWLKSPEL